jgi:autotransporter translocation and assembly factor TamB
MMRLPLRILLTIVLLLVVLGGFTYWVGTRTGLVEQQVNAWLDSFLSAKLPLAVTVGDIGGQPWHNLRVTDIRIDEIDGDTLRPFLHIDTVMVGYNWHDLLARRWRLQEATVAGLRGHLRNEADGRVHSPWKSDSVASPRPSPTIEFEVEDLVIRRVEVALVGMDTSRLVLNRARARVARTVERLEIEAAMEGLTADGARSVAFDTVHAHVVRVGGNWFGDELYLGIGESVIAGTARLNTDTAFAVFASVNASKLRWNDLAQLIGADLAGDGRLAAELQYERGALRGRGTIEGVLFDRTLDGLAVSFAFSDGRLAFDTLYGRALGADIRGRGTLDLRGPDIAYDLDAEIGHFDLSHLVFESPPSLLGGQVEVRGAGVTSDRLRVRISARELAGQLDQLIVQSATGTLLTTVESLYIEPGFRVRYRDIDAVVSGRLAYTGDIALTGSAPSAPITTLCDSLGFPWVSGTADGSFALFGPLADPGLQFDAVIDSLGYRGARAQSVTTSARFDRALSQATGALNARGQKLDLWGVAADSAYVEVGYSPEGLVFSPVALHRQEDSLTARVAFDPETGALTVENLTAGWLGRTFTTPWPAEFMVGEDTLWVHNASLLQDSGSLTINGWVSFDQQVQLEAVTAHVAVAPWYGLLQRSDTLSGVLYADLRFAGPSRLPEVAFRMRLKDAAYNGFLLGDLRSTGTLRDTALLVDSLTLETELAQYIARGRIPLSSRESPWRPDWDGPVDGHVELQGVGLRLISLFLPDVESLTGNVSASADVAGTLGAPRYEGRFVLANGNVKMWQLVEPFSSVELEIQLRDTVATVERARAVVRGPKHDGSLEGSGSMVFRSLSQIDYRLAVTGTNLPLSYEFADFTGRFDAALELRGYEPPVVTGEVKVREAYYRDPFETRDSLDLVATEVEIDTTSWDINVNVDLPNNAWTKNEEVNAEWSGALRVLRQRGVWNYLGRLEPLRGSYDFLGRRFRNLRGQIVFDNIAEVDPRLNLEADVRLPVPRDTQYVAGPVGTAQREITVAVQGRLSAPEINPPAWLGTRNFILALNPLGNPSSQTQGDWLQSATIGATGLLAGGLERLGTRTLGVETFELRPSETGSLDPREAQLSVGAYLLPDVYVYGTAGFDVTQGTEIGFEYRLSNWLTVQGNRDRRNLYQFDLNLRWETDK